MRPEDTRRILAEEETERPDRPPYAQPRNARKPLLWVAALICLALLAATGGETWTLWQEQQTVAQTRSENQRIERDIEQTRQAARQAQTPSVIEREARNLGYIRPGDTPVIIAQPHP
ncbi:MAG TPA: septum formation initiator family protein [Ktedonobacterales bacterium]|jgi:cell division protein FtsB|nr:septum formation initiator family protein [Ktedonobacterales bacterium]